MPKKLLFILSILLFAIISYGKIIYVDLTKESTELNYITFSNNKYLEVEEISKIFNLKKSPSKNIIYLIRHIGSKMDVLELNLINGTVRINFNINDSFASAVLKNNDQYYLLVDAFVKFMGYQKFDYNGNTYIYASIPRIIKIDYSVNKIIFSVSHIVHKEMVIKNKNGIVIVPAINEYSVPSDINFKMLGDNVVEYEIKDFNNYDIQISGRSIILTLNQKNNNSPENIKTVNSSNNVVEKKNIENNINEKTENKNDIETKENDLVNNSNTINENKKANNNNASEEKNSKKLQIDTKLLKVENKMIDLNGRIVPVHIATINPKELEIKVMFNNLGNPEDAEKYLNEENPLVAINAGYFDVSTLEPIGKIITDGKIQHISSYYRPCFIVDEYGVPYIKKVNMEYTIYIRGVPFWIKAINTAWKGDVKLYTSAYKGKIKESEDDYLFLLIENDYIVYIGKKRPINNQKLLLIERKYLKYIKDVAEGDEVIFDIDINQNIAIKELIESGPLLKSNDIMPEAMKEEKLAYSWSIINRKTPRTIVAINNDDMVLFIVVDGYMESNPGINYDEAILLLEKIGNIKQAMMLDGGSSSIFYYNGSILNYRSENWRSKIPAFLGVFKKDR
ncbi:hypothetical protein XO10_03100 [Marinitoga sp. 1135]|uniref:Phosphodiester glycosidase domain-containing protein n=1 Tax=Marinitoga piezophila (strain DSM 14283 / JCM 11233 / KA3) TaxID=443254 RepID=H2J5R3_MARPK|nr:MULTISPECIES: phosphodiester glycosidase family protein [Marinitoga]AEX85049.1 hypothetical protein Marpi_0610 [Marinitoga piezophila KA3]APT75557.1 hypothetical protein LN42_03495 [Marinitoga sp. 1137]NUU95268.1 hypothetical protein [Marinitoga sp. 1135]NUU97202.1 hypothetical protein [Marinitoga sp. 1138]